MLIIVNTTLKMFKYKVSEKGKYQLTHLTVSCPLYQLKDLKSETAKIHSLKVMYSVLPPGILNNTEGYFIDIIKLITSSMNLKLKLLKSALSVAYDGFNVPMEFRINRYDMYILPTSYHKTQPNMLLEKTCFKSHTAGFVVPRIFKPKNSWKIFYREFSIYVWLCFFTVILSIYFLFKLSRYKVNLTIAMMSILFEGSAVIPLVSNGRKMLLLTFLHFCTIITAAYRTRMFDIMIKDFSPELFQDLTDVWRESHFKVGVPSVNLIKIFNISVNEFYKDLVTKNRTFACDYTQYLKQTAEDKNIISYLLKETFMYATPEWCLDKEGRSLVRFFNPKEIPLYLGFSFPQGHPTFTSFNKKIISLIETGVIQYMKTNVYSKYKKAMALADVKDMFSVKVSFSAEPENAVIGNCLNTLLFSPCNKTEVIYSVNVNIQLQVPIVILNTDNHFKQSLLTDPTVFVISGNITTALETLYNKGVLNSRAKFIVLVDKITRELLNVLDDYYIYNILIIVNTTLKMFKYKASDKGKYQLTYLKDSCHLYKLKDLNSQPANVYSLKIMYSILRPAIMSNTTGYYVDIIRLITSSLNLKPNFVKSDLSAAFDGFNVPLNFRINKYDLYILPTPYHYKMQPNMLLDKTCFGSNSAVFVVPRIFKTKNSWKIFYEEFSLYVWLWFFAVILSIYFLFKLSGYKANVTISMMSILFEGSALIPLANNGRKILLLTFLHFCTIITAAYKTRMFDIMIKNFSPELFQDLNDIWKESHFKVGVPSENIITIFKNSVNEFYKDLVTKNRTFICDYTRCLKQTANDKNIVSYLLKETFMYATPDLCLDTEGGSLVRFFDSKEIPLYLGFSFPQGHPTFNRFNKKIMSLTETGIIQYMMTNVYAKYKKSMALADVKDMLRYAPLKVQHLESTNTTEVIYSVNVNLQLQVPIVILNTDEYFKKSILNSPTVFLMSGNITKILGTLYNYTVLNSRAKFIILVDKIDKELLIVLDDYYIYKILIIVKTTLKMFKYKTSEKGSYQLTDLKVSCQLYKLKDLKSESAIIYSLKTYYARLPPGIINSTTGFYFDIVRLITSNMNLTLNLLESNDISDGFTVPLEFRLNRYDFYILPTLYHKTQDNILLEKTCFGSTNAVFVVPRIFKTTNSRKIFYRELSVSVWLCFFVVMLCIYFLFKISSYESNLTIAMISILFEGSASIPLPTKGRKILFITFLHFCTIITAVYRTRMFDIMIKDFSPELFQDLNDIWRESHFKVGMPAIKLIEIFNSSVNEFYKDLVTTNRTFLCRYIQCLNQTANDKDIVSYLLKGTVMYATPDLCLDNEGRSLIRVFDPKEIPVYLAFSFPQGHPTFISFNKKIRCLIETGIVDYILKNVYAQYTKAIALADVKDLLSLLFTTVYRGKMFDIMKTELLSQMVTTKEDILKYELKMGLPGDTFLDVYKMSNDPVDIEIMKNGRYLNCFNFTACLDRVAFNRDIISQRLVKPVKSLIPQYYQDNSGKSLLYIIHRPYGTPYYFGMVFRKGYPLFKEFNKKILILKEAGVVEYLYKKHEELYIKATTLAQLEDGIKYSDLNLQTLQSTFVVYLIGMGFSLLVFFIEIAFKEVTITEKK
ncbi:unnamed protein product [Diabrotica balteata]|uniref:Ionotropic receptor n=1 Tax=Diabrotica balteata TaxID=107213 RepID=A0A9N9SP99_DIABA|nr:unnamed protein product [Diabrotica balteata]